MPTAEDISWFKREFAKPIRAAIAGTPISLNMLAALACQETGEVWPRLRRKGMRTTEILKLCVGDTIDGNGGTGRKAFPIDRSALESFAPDGAAMFAIARDALVRMAAHVPGYQQVAKKPHKFCRGFGIFQYDLQFFKTDPRYFLDRRYESFDASLAKCIGELKHALRRLGLQDRPHLTDMEAAAVAITYNTGGYDPRKQLKQGHRNSAGVYYGEAFFAYLRLAGTVPDGGEPASSAPGVAITASASPVEAAGAAYRVDTVTEPLVLRSAPVKTAPGRKSNRVALLPDGHVVRATSSRSVDGYLEVETSLSGALVRGYAAKAFLKKLESPPPIKILVPAPAAPVDGIVAVWMPRKPGIVTRRTGAPGAHSLNEPGQPGRKGSTPDVLRDELGAIVGWLAPDNKAHLRYQPGKVTYCNVYAHDYCHLGGAYLPRVWWTGGALERLAKGEQVEPVYAKTIEEIRANALFRWLRDFGPRFGWRQTGTLTKLQAEVNQGAVGLIVARHTIENTSGHIVAVVPETETHRAARNSAGEVTAPLQSQAGRRNFSYGTGTADWWLGKQFAEHAFWIHA